MVLKKKIKKKLFTGSRAAAKSQKGLIVMNSVSAVLYRQLICKQNTEKL